MADAALGVAIEALLETVLSLATEKITLAWGLDKELTKLAQKLEMLQALLSDAQSKQVNKQAVQLWLRRLQSVALDAQIVLDEFGYEVLRQRIESRKRDKVRRFFSSSNPVSCRRKLARKVKDVMSSVEQVFPESDQLGLRQVEFINSLPDLKEKRSTSPFVEDSEIVGRDDDTSQVINMLIGSDYHEDLPVITILGMGGQGKTTLAQLVYKNDKVQSHFDNRVWLCVSDDFNVGRLLAEMLQSVAENNFQLTNTEALVRKLKEVLSSKRYLLVLDDVWNENRDEWDDMRGCLLEIGGSKGSKILATARAPNVASAMRTSVSHQLQELSPEHSWELFEKRAFAEGEATKKPELVDIGKRILERCRGVPLAIMAIGGLLYSKHSESDWLTIEKSGVWNDLSGEGNGVLSVIKLSYDHLPSLSVKQCFAYCAIFEKDTRMEKDMLIQLWMAQGLLNPPKGRDLLMEDVGSEYFNILLRSSLLQDAERDGLNNITHCKMHDLVHDVSLQVSENYCFHVKDWKQVSNKIEAVHLTITAGEGEMWKNLKGIVPSKLRTLHLKGRNLLEEDLSANFRCLSALIVEDEDVKDEDAKELPNWIGKMKHLRFLDISGTRIRKFPKSLTELYYLQTLRVNRSLDVVTVGFPHKLINLRHFYVESGYEPNYLLPRIGQLTNLQTLSWFKVDKCDGCQIEELEHLDNLKGELSISGLENVSSRESALKANLSKKSNIQRLKLYWGYGREDCDDSDVMEGLKPHSNIKSLRIENYQSPKFPSWMMRVARNDLNQLRNLVRLQLVALSKCEGLPSLGYLPCLEDLRMEHLDKVKCIGEEFYGYGYGRSSPNPNPNVKDVVGCNYDNGANVITFFPALKSLRLYHMKSVVEWSDAVIPNSSSSSVIVKIFPKLEDMYIRDLPMLRAFPNLGCLPSLHRLEISNYESLTLSPNWNWVVGSPPNIHYLPSLRDLRIKDCGEFTAVFCSLKILAPLQSLSIEDNPSLWPKDLHHLTSLRTLTLGGYYRHNSEVDCFPFFPHSVSHVTSAPSPPPPFDHLQYFPSLTSLSLNGDTFPKVTSLSDQIQYLTSLRDLKISWFNLLEALPEWLGNLTSLQELRVLFCKKLKQLPSAEAFQRLTNLQLLQIIICPLLKERCTEGSGSEWPKIAHIHFVTCSLPIFLIYLSYSTIVWNFANGDE